MTYIDFCDELYADWLAGRNILSARAAAAFVNQRGPVAEFAPEPYLTIGDQSDPLALVMTNPGDAEPFQHRSAVDTKNSPLRSVRFRDASKDLGSYYSGAPAINAKAKDRFSKARTLAHRLGKSGFIVFQLLPFHSSKLDKSLISGLLEEPRLARYVSALSEHLHNYKTVCAVANVFLPASGKPLPETFAQVMEQRLDTLTLTPFTHGRGGQPNTGMLYTHVHGGCRAIYCSGAYNQLPGQHTLPRMVEILDNA